MVSVERIIIQDTPEKFQSIAREMVVSLLELLQKKNSLEAEIWERSEKLEKEKLAAGIAFNQIAPGTIELMDEYKQRYLELVKDRCIPGFLKYGAASSYGMPTKYGYIEDGSNCKVLVIMKSSKKAIVETYYSNGSLNRKHRFTLKLIEDNWLIARLDYGFSAEDGWYVDHYI